MSPKLLLLPFERQREEIRRALAEALAREKGNLATIVAKDIAVKLGVKPAPAWLTTFICSLLEALEDGKVVSLDGSVWVLKEVGKGYKGRTCLRFARVRRG